jgi:protein TonB
MAFNITSWSKKGRDYGRGEPPPRGSIEYVGVGDMFMPAPRPAPGPARAATPPAPPRPAPAAAPARPAPSPRSPGLAGPVMLALGGAACLGISYLINRPRKTTAVAVPDALEE